MVARVLPNGHGRHDVRHFHIGGNTGEVPLEAAQDVAGKALLLGLVTVGGPIREAPPVLPVGLEFHLHHGLARWRELVAVVENPDQHVVDDVRPDDQRLRQPHHRHGRFDVDGARDSERHHDERSEHLPGVVALLDLVVDVRPAQHVEDRAASICGGYDCAGSVLCSVLESDTHRTVVLDQYPLDSCLVGDLAAQIAVASLEGADEVSTSSIYEAQLAVGQQGQDHADHEQGNVRQEQSLEEVLQAAVVRGAHDLRDSLAAGSHEVAQQRPRRPQLGDLVPSGDELGRLGHADLAHVNAAHAPRHPNGLGDKRGVVG